MPRQSHDQGVRKRKAGQKPMDRRRLQFERLKRRHPGPLPWWLRSFKEFLKRKEGGGHAEADS